MIKGTVKYYITETKNKKQSGKISIKDALTSALPFENSEELLAEYDEEKQELIIRKM
jgi:hypothetical protein